jgi:hypothetical protein
MSQLKSENLEKCFSFLRKFIDEAPVLNNKKKSAGLVLDQLQKITTEMDFPANPNENATVAFGRANCAGRPRADST